eukprot:scaffold1272_cov250-Pinguiococcus_pyrenoidosus.AAC.18
MAAARADEKTQKGVTEQAWQGLLHCFPQYAHCVSISTGVSAARPRAALGISRLARCTPSCPWLWRARPWHRWAGSLRRGCGSPPSASESAGPARCYPRRCPQPPLRPLAAAASARRADTRQSAQARRQRRLPPAGTWHQWRCPSRKRRFSGDPAQAAGRPRKAR